MTIENEKQALALAIRTERAHLQDAMTELRHATHDEVVRVKDRFDLKAKIAAHPGRWMLGAFAVGFLLAVNKRRRT